MLAGNLPFGQELATCKRFRHFCKWVREQEKESTYSVILLSSFFSCF
jgi:hypothetical protein